MFSEDWERAILARNNNDSDHLPKKGGLFKSNKTPAQVRSQLLLCIYILILTNHISTAKETSG